MDTVNIGDMSKFKKIPETMDAAAIREWEKELVELVNNMAFEWVSLVEKNKLPAGCKPDMDTLQAIPGSKHFSMRVLDNDENHPKDAVVVSEEFFPQASALISNTVLMVNENFILHNNALLPKPGIPHKPLFLTVVRLGGINTFHPGLYVVSHSSTLDQKIANASDTLAVAVQILFYLQFVRRVRAVLASSDTLATDIRFFVKARKIAAATLAGGDKLRTPRMLLVEKALRYADIVLSGALVAVNAYALYQAKSVSDKYRLATTVAFDAGAFAASSYSTLIGIAARFTVAGLPAWSAAAVPVGYLSIPLAGVGIGLSGLFGQFGNIIDTALHLGSTFDAELDAFRKGYQIQQADHSSGQVAVAEAGSSTITRVNLRKGHVIYSAAMMYSMEWKPGAVLPGTNLRPDVIKNKDKALDLSIVFRLPDSTVIPVWNKDTILVLPSMPKHYYSVRYNLAPFSTFRNDAEFDSFKKLEKTGKFFFNCDCSAAMTAIKSL